MRSMWPARRDYPRNCPNGHLSRFPIYWSSAQCAEEISFACRKSPTTPWRQSRRPISPRYDVSAIDALEVRLARLLEDRQPRPLARAALPDLCRQIDRGGRHANAFDNRNITGPDRTGGGTNGRSPLRNGLRPQLSKRPVALVPRESTSAGDYIASTGIKGTDGKLHAIEVRIFPESLRGVGEGQYPWDLKPDSVMTNATVGTITQAPQGNVVKVSYKGTESEYTVDPTTPIFANATGDRSLLAPGAAVFVIASKQDDGKLTSTRLYVEKDGIKPPM